MNLVKIELHEKHIIKIPIALEKKIKDSFDLKNKDKYNVIEKPFILCSYYQLVFGCNSKCPFKKYGNYGCYKWLDKIDRHWKQSMRFCEKHIVIINEEKFKRTRDAIFLHIVWISKQNST